MARRYVATEEVRSILYHCHSNINGGHYGAQRITAKVLESGFYWPTLFQDAKGFVMSCDAYQRTGNI